MKSLLIVTAVLEGAIGVLLVLSPALPVAWLFDTSLETQAAWAIARLAGAAILGLAITCWQARHDARSPVARGLLAAMLYYNVAATVILSTMGVGSKPVGLCLWPAVAIHVALAGWCLAHFKIGTRTPSSG